LLDSLLQENLWMAISSGGAKPLGLSKLTEHVSSQAEASKERGRKLLGHRDAYCSLQKKLLTLSNCMTHKVMVPFTSKAFMPGKLVHTNEILVLLGDNWFIETSSKRAADIASRRIEQCDKMLQKIEDEVKLIEGWQNRTDAFGKESDECVDIREEYEEEKEKQWKNRHKENVKKEKVSDNIKIVDDESLWKRLEELEVQEALEREWDEDSDEENETSESETETDVSDEESGKNCGQVEDQGGLAPVMDDVRKVKRRVSWVGIDSGDKGETLSTEIKINFHHSEQPPPHENLVQNEAGYPEMPSDLVHFACKEPKSILKPTDSKILVRESSEDDIIHTDDGESEPAVQERILERAVCDKPLLQPDEPKKVSRFKASRLKK